MKHFKNILLIGATGQIGYAIAERIAKTDYKLRILVRNRHKIRFPENIEIIEANEFSPNLFKQALDGADHAIYSVGLPEQFTLDDSIFDRANYGIFRIFLEVIAASTTRNLTYISAYEVFKDVNGSISESHGTADESKMTNYFKSMTKAYRIAVEAAGKTGIRLTTIHPAAVYGGLNTGNGLTNYMENLRKNRFWKVPFIIDGSFPVVHSDSLADAVLRTLDTAGAFIVSDQMASLKAIARSINQQTGSRIPVTVPVWIAYLGTSVLDFVARLLSTHPIMSSVQVKFITAGYEPQSFKIQTETGWVPVGLDEGVKQYLARAAEVGSKF
jgi:nucleoside-diphosphate-sugar epimerase